MERESTPAEVRAEGYEFGETTTSTGPKKGEGTTPEQGWNTGTLRRARSPSLMRKVNEPLALRVVTG